MKNYKLMTVAVMAGLACSAATSEASLSVTYEGGPVTAPGGTQIGTTESATYSDPTFNLAGTLVSQAFTGTAFGFTGYTFVYQVINTGSDSVDGLSLNGFSGSVGVAYGTGGSGVGTLNATAASADINGSTIDVTFGGGFAAATSDYIYVYTDLTSAALILDGVKDSGVGSALAYSPVPEPTTVVAAALMMLPLGVGALRSLRKERLV